MEPVKILVVDDESKICQNVKKILSKKNYKVTSALSAQEAVEKMAKDSFSLLISDIVMPGQNGLALLKLVKQQWPLTKAVIMTAYASTDTAIKAIRLGALDYITKPFTPDELRSKVDKALLGELVEVQTSDAEKEMIDVIDLDVPFEAKEVAETTGEDYVKILGRSDMPVVEVKLPTSLPNYCAVGTMVCDIFKKLGATCKAGTKTGDCPQKRSKKSSAKTGSADTRTLIGIDQPFRYDEVVSMTGPEYVSQLGRDGVAYVPYEELKKAMAPAMRKGAPKKIDVDMPFDRAEVERVAGADYAVNLSRSDVPVVEVSVPESLPNYCQVGHMVCDIFKKLGATCKAGNKSGECPQLKAKKTKAAAPAPGLDATKWIGPDLPFDIEEVAAVAGPDYARHLYLEDRVVMPYEELKKNMEARLRKPQVIRPEFHREVAAERILVVDDEVAVNNNIRKILAKKGHEVDQATSKAEALERINEQPYCLVILDLKMPGVRGLELLAAIQDRQPAAKVIIITGYASIETAVEAARLGAVDYLAKPFTPAEIRMAAESAFRLAA